MSPLPVVLTSLAFAYSDRQSQKAGYESSPRPLGSHFDSRMLCSGCEITAPVRETSSSYYKSPRTLTKLIIHQQRSPSTTPSHKQDRLMT